MSYYYDDYDYDCYDRKHGKRKRENRFVDFEFFTNNPQQPIEIVPVSQNPSAPTIVAQIELDSIKAKDRVWLNGLFHIDNDNTFFVTLDVRIYKNTIIPGNEIYRSTIEIDQWFADDLGQPIPVQTVETFSQDDDDVTYLLTVSVNAPIVFLNAPRTFTAVLIR